MKSTLPRTVFRSHFLYLLPVFFVLHGCAENFPLIKPLEAIELIGYYLFITAILFALSFLAFRSVYKAAFFSFFLLSFHLLFGAVQDFLKGISPGIFLARYIVILPAALLVFVWVFIFLKRTQLPLLRATKYLNTVIAVLIVIDGVFLGIKFLKAKPADGFQNQISYAGPRPNIYLILSDEYAGQKELHDIFKFDNSAFEDSLRAKGFQVLHHTTSNYNYTPYSMASLFQMDYIHGISSNSSDFNNRKIVFQKLNSNTLVEVFKRLGYRFVNQSLFDFAGLAPNRSATDFYFTGKRIITSQTLTSRLKRDLWYHLIIDLNWTWAKNNYLNTLKEDIATSYAETVKQAASGAAPVFTYTHFIMPHYPYLYDENGKENSFEESVEKSTDRYIGFMKYGSKLCLRLIDEIKKRDTTKPIIIFMSDHGYTKYEAPYPPFYNFTNIVNVFNSAPLPDTMSNVNLFPLLLNRNFGTNLPLSKDSSIYLTE